MHEIWFAECAVIRSFPSPWDSASPARNSWRPSENLPKRRSSVALLSRLSNAIQEKNRRLWHNLYDSYWLAALSFQPDKGNGKHRERLVRFNWQLKADSAYGYRRLAQEN